MKRFKAVSISSALLVFAFLSTANAATSAEVAGETITITGGDEANHVELFYSLIGSFVAISDPAGLTGSASCPLGGDQIQCPLTPATIAVAMEAGGGPDSVAYTPTYVNFIGPGLRFDFFGGGGNDVFTAIGAGRIQGGSGSDRLTGGSAGENPHNRLIGGGGSDRLRDDEGDDALIGGGGRDRLNGGDNRDRYSGGGGRDRIGARDFTQDKRIDCGPGIDRLRADEFDPQPRSC